MDEALRTSVESIKAVIAFLDKVKLDKKYRKEKDDLVKSLNSSIARSNTFLLSAEHSTASGKNDGELYDDVGKAPDTYDDVHTNNAIYSDTADSQIYDDAGGITNDTTKESSETKSSPKVKDGLPAIACDQLSDASIADFLESKRERTLLAGGWKKRWCVLHRNILYFYESSKDKKQKDSIDLTGFTFLTRDDITREVKRKERCFELKHEQLNKSFDFCASDKDAVTKWKTSLLQAGVIEGENMSDTVSMKSDSNESASTLEATQKKSSLFSKVTGLASKVVGKSGAPTNDHDAQGSGDGVYADTADENPNYDDTNVLSVYNDTCDGENYADTATIQGDQVYDDTMDSGETYEEFGDSQPAPAIPIAKQELPSPPSSNLPTPLRGPLPPPSPSINTMSLPPPPSPAPGRNPPAWNSSMERNRRASAKTPSLHLQPQSPVQSAPALPPLPSSLHEDVAGGNIPGRRDSRPPPVPLAEKKPSITDTKLPSVSTAEAEDDYENMYQGMWDCQADEDNELPFKRGELVHVISREYDNYGWWIAKKEDIVGLVPRDYLMEAYEI